MRISHSKEKISVDKQQTKVDQLNKQATQWNGIHLLKKRKGMSVQYAFSDLKKVKC
jgi:hypothetical protein